MGMYDIAMVRCPSCQHITPFQSKAGSCTLREIDIMQAEPAIMQDLQDRSPLTCCHCGRKIAIRCIAMVQVYCPCSTETET